jgi:hypothetical protein
MDAKQIIDRASKLQDYEVIVTMPAEWRFKGVVPFDMHIVGDQAFVTVLAESIEEAKSRAQSYVNSLSEEEDE